MITFFVPGVPVAKGSAKAFVIKNKASGKHRAIVTQTNGDKQKPWASMIGTIAQMQNMPMMFGPVKLSLTFHMPRIKGHYRAGKNSEQLRPDAPVWHIVKPDLDKLVRCVKDALTGVIWKDDSQVALMPEVKKIYADCPGVTITVSEIKGPCLA